MPTPDMLLAPQRQRVDQLSDALASGLRHRIADARAHLGQVGGALRPSLLRQQLARATERLDRLRPRPDYLARALFDRATAFDRVSRHFASLDPDLPLARGYARVMAQGRLVQSVAAAQAAGAVTLHFKDGTVDAAVGHGGAPLEKPDPAAISMAPRPARKPRGADETPQQDLFS
jgi:exodeoxyribonuclease VII large subunit